MNKEQLLQELSQKITTGEITYDEMMNRFNLTAVKTEASSVSTASKMASHFSVTKMLYVLGAIIVVIGAVLFSFQIWDDIGSVGRISITLGLGVLLTAIGSLLSKNKPETQIGTVFHFIGGILIPGGAMVALYELTNGEYHVWPMALTFGVIFLFYLFINYIHKNVVLTFFTVANGTAFVYLTVNAITDGLFNDYTNIFAYLTLVVGACYVLLGYSFRNTWNDKLVGPLYVFGLVGIEIAALTQYSNAGGYYSNHSLWPAVLSFGLISIFYFFLNSRVKHPGLTLLTILNITAFVYVFVAALLGGSFYENGDIYAYLTMIIGVCYLLLSYSFRNDWNKRLTEVLNFLGSAGLLIAGFSEIYDSLPWQLFYLIIVIATFGVSIYMRSRSILVTSTCALIAYVSYITSEYFADSIGWPISLVILGFIFIALGYVSIAINKKYIKGN
jgi:hypothetical protein